MNALLQTLSLMTQPLLELFAPWRCVLCMAQIPAEALCHYLCQRCWDRLEPAPPPYQLVLHIERHCGSDASALHTVMVRWSAHPSEPRGLFRLIHLLKYYGYWRIGVELGRELGATVALLSTAQYDAIVPVPIHSARRRERGYNQAEAIAEGIAEVLSVPIWRNAIRRTRYTQSQTQLSTAERQINTRGAFGAGKEATRLHRARILVVDDVLTTGSTLTNVALAAQQLGAERVDAATIVVATL